MNKHLIGTLIIAAAPHSPPRLLPVATARRSTTTRLKGRQHRNADKVPRQSARNT